jgi:hypothetical protein
MIPEKRVRQALLNVEKRQIIEDLAQINASILHFLSGGKQNYNAAKSNNPEQYKNTSDEILLSLERRRQEQENRLGIVSDELASLDNEK